MGLRPGRGGGDLLCGVQQDSTGPEMGVATQGGVRRGQGAGKGGKGTESPPGPIAGNTLQPELLALVKNTRVLSCPTLTPLHLPCALPSLPAPPRQALAPPRGQPWPFTDLS